MKGSKIVSLLIAAVLLASFTSCDDDDSAEISSAQLSADVAGIDFGRVLLGSSVTQTVTITGSDIEGFVMLATSNTAFTLSQDDILTPNSPATIEITATFTESDAEGQVNAVLTATAANTSLTIELRATAAVNTGLPVGTEIYSNKFEFGLGHNERLFESDFSNTGVLGDGVEASYSLVFVDETITTDDRINIRVQGNSGRCEDGTAGSDGLCGSGFIILGTAVDETTMETLKTSVTFTFTGLEAERNYQFTYHVRPNGSSERAMSVIVPGDATDAFELYVDSDNSVYQEKSRTGTSDVNGEISIKFEYDAESVTRAISIDDLIVTAN